MAKPTPPPLPTSPPRVAASTGLSTLTFTFPPLFRQALLGLAIAMLVVFLLLFAGSEDRGFIYVDF